MTAAPHRQKGTHYYRCARYIAQRDCPGATIEAHIIDAIVWAHAERVITDPQAIDLEVARMRNSEPPDHDIDAVERRIIEVERRQQRLARMIAALDDDAAAAPLLKELKDLSQQRKALDADRETVLARRRNWAATAGQLEMLREHWHEAFAAEVAELGYDERRRALDALGIQVRVYRKEHNPRWEITANIPLVDSYASTTMHTPTANTLCPSSSNRSFPAGCCHAIKVSPVPPSAALPNEPHEYQPCRPATPSGARMPRKIIHRYRSRRPRS